MNRITYKVRSGQRSPPAVPIRPETCDDVAVSRALKISLSLILLVIAAALAVWSWFLSGRDLDDADKMSSVAGLFVSFPLGVAGLVFAILAWRDGRHGRSKESGKAGSHFTVTAGRDAYTAEQMTINQSDGPAT
ncbi:hypothetical protein AB0C12_13205 [Actinoplanes sp. NPDC048967]|uniref:hypothetical protein n=1 Tax=Actinoplanes sp. NPDC048967 TaxID=3155269 RepID=UPI0033C84D95